MIFDIKTLILLNFIGNLINVGTMTIIWYQYRRRFAGLSFWLVYMILEATGIGLILLRGLIPDFITIVISNTLLLSGTIFLLIGLERFVGVKGPQIQNYVLMVGYVLVVTFFFVVQPDMTMREIIISAMIVLLESQICWLIFRKSPHNLRKITRIVGYIIGCTVIITFVRMLLLIAFPLGTSDFFKSGFADEMAVTFYVSLNICLIIGLILMVTQRLLGEVQAQEEKFTIAFHSSPYAIMLTNAGDGKIFDINQGFTSITGYTPGEVIGHTTQDLSLWSRDEDRAIIVQELSKRNNVRWVEVQLQRKTGDLMTGLFSADEIQINNEPCIIASISDITDRKRAEDALRQANRQLNLLSSITRHDINNMLQVILGYLGIVQESSTDPKTSSILQKIETATMAIWAQIEFTKVYQDLGAHKPLWKNLDSVLPRSHVPAGIVFYSEVQGIQIFADPILEKVFFNLLDNSIRHGERVSEIHVSSSKQDDNLTIIWEDNGVGIPDNEKERIFERGFGKNTGLGMFLVREILSLTGILIKERGIFGKGVRFEITIPHGGYRLGKNTEKDQASATNDSSAQTTRTVG
ncbi:MAG TPA: PAS domain S-box protein [Methanospirillum sp.]|nr:PAS domain S-box protein [Methanospirillum sp.]